ncbi:site-specific DNA-methyltransferase [Muricauda sp. 2012CJ35-5]|uniref:site-specific DNA-methyltransferase (cytosine-N(4)-specific) n=1 Tax=Flagellimonas spongiicola TaxID=2942208 RepID=A0ABT0PU82_9FLAO|nr:DNA methyltransferase [Allomuricauda spongiicola]MCL6274950.1 site-specific DNA-methyltransferase [Allomuricauda spongiicola]
MLEIKEHTTLKKSLEEDLPKELVDIADKKRSNLFAWRGQFSPQLIESLIENYSGENDVMYDPFCGSGTLLLESALFNLKAFGTELNPAAFGLASIYRLTQIDRDILNSSIEFVENLILDYFPLEDLFNNAQGKDLNDLKNELVTALNENKDSINGLIINALIIGLDFEQKKLTHGKLQVAWENLKSKIKSLPQTNKEINIFLGDARKSKIRNNSIDFVITSPPYINVFNYHQNYRRSVEATGYNVLRVAKSEIGSNRKFRSNRFLTVVQYAMDIFQVFEDLKRICKPDAKIIFIVGRESSVRKTSFSNAKLLTEVANLLGFRLVGEQPRMFRNKFGLEIYEEILRFSIDFNFKESSIKSAKEIGINYLKKALKYAPDESLEDLKEAIQKGTSVEPSIIYSKD